MKENLIKIVIALVLSLAVYGMFTGLKIIFYRAIMDTIIGAVLIGSLYINTIHWIDSIKKE